MYYRVFILWFVVEQQYPVKVSFRSLIWKNNIFCFLVFHFYYWAVLYCLHSSTSHLTAILGVTFITLCPKFYKYFLGPPVLSIFSITAFSICSLEPNNIVGSKLPDTEISSRTELDPYNWHQIDVTLPRDTKKACELQILHFF